MDTATSSLIVACVGITGTLVSGLLAHSSARRNKLHELEHAEKQRDSERSYAAQLGSFEVRRSVYLSLNGAARHYQTELTNYLHAQKTGAMMDEARNNVEEARREHRARHAEAQMILPDEILVFASTVNRHLGRLYGVLRRIEIGQPDAGESLELAEGMRVRAWDLLAEMRQAMRNDLGVSPRQSP